MKLASSILFVVLVLAGCDNPTAVSSELITARASSQTLQITNITDDRVYYFVAESSTLPLLDWAVCTDPANTSCTYVEAGGRAVVFHWRLIPSGSGKYDYDSVRNLIVDLE